MLLHGSAPPKIATREPLRFALIFIGGWTLMTVAMMLPTSVPLLLMFQRMVASRAASRWLTGAVIAGYLGVWGLAGVAVQLVNWVVQAAVTGAVQAAGVADTGRAAWIGTAAILGIAGLFQFSSLKYACLKECRSPLSFLIAHWRGGNETLQALRLGAAHGLFCVGCCWALMLLMLVIGTGSTGGMLALGALMAIEKNFAWGRKLSKPLGLVLFAGGAAAFAAGALR
jgi:predicted metal-binding membrane protein